MPAFHDVDTATDTPTPTRPTGLHPYVEEVGVGVVEYWLNCTFSSRAMSNPANSSVALDPRRQLWRARLVFSNDLASKSAV